MSEEPQPPGPMPEGGTNTGWNDKWLANIPPGYDTSGPEKITFGEFSAPRNQTVDLIDETRGLLSPLDWERNNFKDAAKALTGIIKNAGAFPRIANVLAKIARGEDVEPFPQDEESAFLAYRVSSKWIRALQGEIDWRGVDMKGFNEGLAHLLENSGRSPDAAKVVAAASEASI